MGKRKREYIDVLPQKKEKKKILIVDDDEIQLVTAELFLKNEYEIWKMQSGKETLEYLRNNEFVPDIILLDIIMPNMDGWELLEEIRNIGFLKNVPIMFLTGVTEESEIIQACEEGVADYVTKPFGYVELRKRIELVLKGYRMKVSYNYNSSLQDYIFYG
jgi:putative two-component system response regulator